MSNPTVYAQLGEDEKAQELGDLGQSVCSPEEQDMNVCSPELEEQASPGEEQLCTGEEQVCTGDQTAGGTFPASDAFGQCVSNSLTLEYGATGNEVKLLQKLLQNGGYAPGLIDGKFGPNTKAAVIKFQETNGLVKNGQVDTKTWNALCKFATQSVLTNDAPIAAEPSSAGEITKWQKVKRGYGGLEGNGGGKLRTELTKLRDENKIQITNNEIEILQHVADVETSGYIQGINTWDSGVISFGYMQWTLKYGELQDLIKRASDRFKNFGIEVEGTYSIKSKKPGVAPVIFPGIKGVTDHNLLRSQEWAEKFFRAGLDEEIIIQVTNKALEQLHKYQKANGLLGTAWNNHFNDLTAISLIFEAHNNLPAAAKTALKNTFEQTKAQSITDKEFNEILATNILKSYKARDPPDSAEHLVKTILGYIPSA